MVKKIAVALVVLLLLLAGVVASRPDSYRVERVATIAAPAELLFPMVNDFHRWGAWSPWEKLDPAMKRSFEGPAAGVGAKYGWSGNDEVGEGRMTIVESQPPARIGIKLEFVKPWESTSDTLFTFAQQGAATRVTWAMEGRHNFVSKAFSMFAAMDAMVGPDFEKGLASMKGLAEAEALKAAAQPPPAPPVP